MVTPEAPVKAVKTAQTKRETTASPPGIQPSSSLDNCSIRLGALLSESMRPAKMNRGRDTKRGVSASLDISIMTTEISISAE